MSFPPKHWFQNADNDKLKMTRDELQQQAEQSILKGYDRLKHLTATDLTYNPPPPYNMPLSYKYKVNPTTEFVSSRLHAACNQLPWNLTKKIQTIRFGPEGVIDPKFEVVFMGGHTITFDDVDSFPSEADIARIALECP